jgi:glycerophosphoryl diester phosphodiesterase
VLRPDLQTLARRAGRPLVFGHRGAAASAPENTLLGVRVARDAGADGVEIDIRATRDGECVVFHDATIARLCGDDRPIGGMTLADLRSLRVGGQPIPTLDELLEEASGLHVNVEIKTDGAKAAGLERAAASRLERHEVSAWISSFDPWALRRFRRAAPGAAIGILVDDGDGARLARRDVGARLGVAALHPHWSLCTTELVARAHRANRAVVTWTVNDTDEARRLRDLGVDGLISDDPGRVRAAL